MTAQQPPPEPILPPGPPGFPFEWQEPDDAELSWEWDNMHHPTALAPLSVDYIMALSQGFEYRYERLDIPLRILTRVWNGYAYYSARFGVPDDEIAAIVERSRQSRRELIVTAKAYWTDVAVPELRAGYEHIDRIDVEGASPPALAAEWERAWSLVERAWRIHFFAIAAAYQVLEDLADRYESLVPEAAAGDALRLIQGGVDELQDVAAGIERLTDLARAEPAVGTWIRDGATGDPPPEGAFGAELAAFLARHGHLGQGWDDLELPSWGEEPTQLLADIGRRLEQSPERAAERRLRLAADAHRLLEDLRERLSDRPDELASFETLLAAALEVGPITETHNYWIDRMAQARLRRLVTRVGSRLVTEGAVGQAADIFFLRRAEVAELISAPRNVAEVVAERRAERDRQRRIVPPPWVGQPPESGGGRFDAPEPVERTEQELHGAGASAGVVRGPARVTLSQDDFSRIRPGDIIVCPSSNPSWVPLFSIAAGLVTDTGGVLSHAAVVAREFGLPAVVGTRDATTRIADGQLVEIDGSSGVVRLL